MREILQKIVHDKLNSESDIRDIAKLHGDASYRTYYRMSLADGASYIVMEMPPGKSSASEEITNFKGAPKELPFINVARYLKKIGMAVPEVYYYDENNRLIILQDLGDELMAKKIEGGSDEARLKWYKKAIDVLVSLQKKTESGGAGDCVAFRRSFDADLLNWEFDHFLEYGIEARLKEKMEGADLKIFNDETRAITAEIEKLQFGFTHRDFQSRNILIKDGALYLIDFQDALMGPYIYDLVSLTRDSYVKLSDAILDDLLEYYASAKKVSVENLRRDFDLVTVQRKLKDAGRFVYIDRVKGNPKFLQYIPASLEYVKVALERLPEYGGLYAALKKYAPEWK